MRHRLPETLPILLLVIVCVSCAPVYVPNIRNTPLFDEKGEFQVTASAGTGYHLQTAYAFSNHVGVVLNGAMADNQRAKKFQYRTHQFVETGIGYYGKTGKLYFELYGGFGFGKGETKDSVYYVFDDDILYSAKTSYQRIFVQPAIGTKHDNFEWSLATRISRVNYNELQIFYQADPVAVSERHYLYLEPALNLKIALKEKRTFFVMQGGVSIPIYNESGNEFDVERFSGAMGLQFRIAPKQTN